MVGDIPNPPEGFVLFGKLGKPHGLSGEMKIICFSEQPGNLAEYSRLFLMDETGKISRGLKIVNYRVQGKGAIVQLETVTSRNEAELLTGAATLIAEEDLPPLAENGFYYYQFYGKLVVDRDGKKMGLVKQIFHNGAQDILVVSGNHDEILIPVTKSIVLEKTETELIVELPPGLLDLNESSE